MQHPLVDICIPTCNSNPAYLRQAIDSALAQTESRWRMYIHDDGSQTDVASIVEPYLKDSRISWHPNRSKLGIGGNWNATMKLGNAPYVQFLFQDDWWEPEFLARGLQAMEEHPSVGMVSLHHRYVHENHDREIPPYERLEHYRIERLQPGMHPGRGMLRHWLSMQLHPNIIGEPDFVMYRRSVMEQAGDFLEDMPQNLDMEYSLRMLVHADWYWVPALSGSFRVHGDATSAQNEREGKGVFDRFRCFEELIGGLPTGEDRSLAIRMRNAALEDMAGKFLRKIGKGTTMLQKGGTAGGAFKKFALRHPWLVGRAVLRALLTPSSP